MSPIDLPSSTPQSSSGIQLSTGTKHARPFLALILVRVASAALLAGSDFACFAETLIVLSPHNEAIREEFQRAFSKWHQGRHGSPADIDWRIVGGSSESVRFVQSEFARKPDGIGVDVFFGGGQEPYYELAEKRFLQPCPLPEPVLSGLAPDVAGIELRARDDTWYGAAISSFGILQNLRVQQFAGLPYIRRWEDLARPELKGWVGSGDPRGSGTMLVMFESFLQARGWEDGWSLLARLGGNTRRFDRVSATTAKDAAVGDTAYALAIDFFAFTQIGAAGKTNLSFALPLDFTAINPDGIAILRGAPHLELSRRFLEFVLSDAGQLLWILPQGHPQGPQRHSIERMPVRPALHAAHRNESHVDVSPFELSPGFRYDARLAQQRRGVVATLAGALLVDTHESLVSAWSEVIRRGSTPADISELGRPPITAAEARELSGNPWKDPAFRNAKRTEWLVWASRKYQRLAANPAP